MIITLIVAVLAAGAGVLRGGSLTALADTRFRWVALLLTGLAVQVIYDIWRPEGLSDRGALMIVLASFAAVAGFLLINWRLPGMVLAGTGLALNVVAIAANGAMPVWDRAVDAAGLSTPSSEEFGVKHEPLTDDTVLPWITDVIPIPILETVISVGDVLLAAGIGWLVFARTVSRSGDREVARRRAPRR
ncbi:MAG: DUF5317 domain-containing protein [Actinomycetota bacterium]